MVTFGVTVEPVTETVNDVAEQPVNVLVAVTLYTPGAVTVTLLLLEEPEIPAPVHVYVKFAEGVNVGAIVTTEFVQDNACAVPVPATNDGDVVAILTVRTVLVVQPFISTTVAE
jgi:hypothetical protein